MTLDKAKHQKLGRSRRSERRTGEARKFPARGEAVSVPQRTESLGRENLLEQALSRENMVEAWKRVKANKGSAGVDGLSITQTIEYLQTQWPVIRDELLRGSYRPSAVRRVEIPKPGGGSRELGIPTVIDRLIQQALLQVLQPLLDPTFSEFSYGFRPGRSAHDAVLHAQQCVQQGYQVVVDLDLEKFFDRVNHDVLMDRLSKRIDDKAVLRLIRRFLRAGVMINGVLVERLEGTVQGSPLSPLLANVLLDEVDQALERRGHKFARYADDCNVYVRSQRAGERVLRSLRKLYAKLHLRVNEAKTAVGPVFGRKLLGYCLRRWSGNTVKIAVSPSAIVKFKQRIRQITRRVGGRSLVQVAVELRSFIPGWKAYFHLARTPKIFRDLDGWIRRRLRAIQLKHWRRGRTTFDALRRLGASQELAKLIACSSKRCWHNSLSGLHFILSVKYYDGLDVPRLS
ncbi:group II intron reverse transcriptase/maturase [Granulosicoccus antarcticus]|uniref:RNA-directed DNA polymerase n=1 Tax=Granulosicoccus antarcticus IMCC3135 TaxID=1192854 RepID=A0A2Z2P0R1_9GAMM|nr:group II intron reverse transcriptase/maturase [Granulosicoccus antarcticus]ASJ76345.1 Group II intron-encoded protein LtrA [Granulosicoccus antarcticus IMCC3135]